MKKWFVVSGIVFLFFAAAAVGRIFNSQFIFDSIRSDALFKARQSILEFKQHHNPKFKTIVVFGTSSSLFSYPDQEKSYYPQNLSYVDLMPKNINVLNLSNHHFFSYEQFEAVLDLLQNELPLIDYVILENLRFMAPTPRLVDEWDYIAIATQSCRQAQNYFQMNSLCNDVFSHMYKAFHLSAAITNRCMKKFDKILNLSYFQDPNSRQKTIINALRCDQDSNKKNDTLLLIMEKFRFGQLMDLAIALEKLGSNINYLEPSLYRESYYPLDQVILNFYLNKLALKYQKYNFLVIPSAAKKLSGLDSIEAFQKRDNLHFFEINSYLENVMSQNHQNFIDLFPDGSHAKLWIHHYLAHEISLKYLQ